MDVELKKANTDQSIAAPVVDHDEEERLAKEAFVPSSGLTTAEAENLLHIHGRNELEEKVTPKWLIYLKMLWGPMPCMIWLAIIVELAITNWLDAGILLGIQFANATIGWYETTKAGDAVAALKASLKPVATVKRDGKWQNIDAPLLVPGDLVLLAAGSAVPADCRVNKGQVQADQSAMTGESLPVSKYPKDLCFMGSTITRGETEGTVAYTGKLTFFGKTATMLNQADGLGNLQKILLKIMFVLVVLSLSLCAITLIYLTVHKGIKFKEALSFTVVLLVASIPIAIEIVCTATLALGSRQLSAHGAIVTRLIAIEEMAGMNMLCSDKTGTLTLNQMVIQEDCPTYSPGQSLQTVLQMAALAAKWKEPARDALDTMVLGAADLHALDIYEQLDFMPFDPTQKRTEGTVRCIADGRTFKVTKGAPNIIAALVDVDHERVMKEIDWKVQELATRGIRSLAVARTNEGGQWVMLGLLTFLDPPRPDTKRTIERAIEYGVDVKMITGDHTVIAKEMARTLGMGGNIQNAKGLPHMPADGTIPKDLGTKYAGMILAADGFAQVYPEHKFLIVEALRQAGFACGMTGDGVNDAPALKRADIGIAVEGSTDAARAAADIVLTQPGLGVVVEAIVIARMIFQRIKNFINYRIAATLQLLTFFFIAVFVFDPSVYWGHRASSRVEPKWPEFFSLPVLMLMLITLLNDGTLISIGYDYVNPSPRPEKWNLKALFLISAVLGAVACVSSLLLLWGALDSHNPNGMFAAFRLPAMEYGKITTLIYLKVSLSDFLTLFSARTHSEFFWARKPSPILLFAAALALTLSTLLAALWPASKTDGIHVKGLCLTGPTRDKLWPLWVWLYCITWWFIQDAVKVGAYWIMEKYDIFQIRTAGLVNLRDAMRADDEGHPLARQSVAVLESRNLENKVEAAIRHVNELTRLSGGSPRLMRVSQKLALARSSATLARRSVGPEGRLADMQAGMAEAEQTISEIEVAVEGLDDVEHRAALEAPLRQLQEATAKLAESSAKLAEGRGGDR